MTPFSFHRSLLLCFALALTTLCAGCSGFIAKPDRVPEHKETYYFDAQLTFAMEHPANWKLVRDDNGENSASCQVRWEAPPGESGTESVAWAEVTACPLSRWPGGREGMREDFLAQHPALRLSDENEVVLPGGQGLMLVGSDPSRTWMTIFLVAMERGYIVGFSAPNDDFAYYRPLFEEMLESFRPQAEQ